MLLAVLDTSVFRLFERPVMEHQLRVVLLSSCPGGYIVRLGEEPSLGPGGCGYGLCVRPWAGPLPLPIRQCRPLFGFRLRPRRVVGVSGGGFAGLHFFECT